MTKRALITGATGMDGRHLSELLLSKGYKVFGLVRRTSQPSEVIPGVQVIYGDLTDQGSLNRAVLESVPDEVYNLGAQSFVGSSWQIPVSTMDITGTGALRMLEALRLVNPKARFYQASSSEMFGNSGSLINESTRFAPRSPYGVAKVAAHYATVNYRESYDMFACCGILFNHESVPYETSVVLRKNGFIDVRPIGSIVPHRTNSRHGKSYTSDGGDYEIWDGNNFVKVLGRTAYWFDGELYTTHGRGAVVSTTADHVIFTSEGEKSAKEVNDGDRIITTDFFDVKDISVTTEEEAWLLGILIADGYIAEDGAARVANNNETILSRVDELWKLVANGASRRDETKSGFSEKKVKTVELSGNPSYAKFLRSEIYEEDKTKRVPVRILNSSHKIKIAFLEGYNSGDGLKAGNRKDTFKSFRTTSNPLATALIWLAQTALGRAVSVYRQEGTLSGGHSWLINLSSPNASNKGLHLVKPKDEVRKITTERHVGWLFDIETESQKFAAGPGLMVIHNSPMRGIEFVTRKISNAVAQIRLGYKDFVELGNLDAGRDWGYAGDYVKAMWMMLQQDTPDDYVVATGRSHKIHEFLDVAFNYVGISDWSDYVRISPQFYRPAEIHDLVGDATKAREILNWAPTMSFVDLVEHMVQADLDREVSSME